MTVDREAACDRSTRRSESWTNVQKDLAIDGACSNVQGVLDPSDRVRRQVALVSRRIGTGDGRQDVRRSLDALGQVRQTFGSPTNDVVKTGRAYRRGARAHPGAHQDEGSL